MPGKQFDDQVEGHFRADKQRIMFIRHGESEAHVGKAATHIEEVGLTLRGEKKALEIASEFPRAPDLIVVSPYLRAWKTADPTIKRFSETPHVIWPEVQEFTYLGSLAGAFMTKEERSTYVKAYWDRCDPLYKDGNAESFFEFVGRARKALEKLRVELEEKNFIVVFTHEQFIRVVQCLLLLWEDGAERGPQCMESFRKMLCDYPLDYGHKDDESWRRHLLGEKDFLQEEPQHRNLVAKHGHPLKIG
jgi:2,3-bisphosphoglycerate-dependent phosphoglycerate mutase